jgi:hypothetical protein
MKAVTCKCKNCGIRFTPKRSSLESSCSTKCAIENEQKKFLTKGTPAFKAAKVEVKIGETRNELQRKINMLARMIDAKYGFNTCIDCGKPFGKQIDAAHYHDLSTNRGVRFNLHNLHSAKSDCNKYSSKHKDGYIKGLAIRYNDNYAIFIQGLKFEFKEINLNAIELKEKLKTVNKLIRDFDTYQTTNAIHARGIFNKIIQIYEK